MLAFSWTFSNRGIEPTRIFRIGLPAFHVFWREKGCLGVGAGFSIGKRAFDAAWRSKNASSIRASHWSRLLW